MHDRVTVCVQLPEGITRYASPAQENLAGFTRNLPQSAKIRPSNDVKGSSRAARNRKFNGGIPQTSGNEVKGMARYAIPRRKTGRGPQVEERRMYWLRKKILPIPALIGAHPALTLAFRLWNDSRDEGCLPPRCAVDTPQFRLLVPDAHWIDLRRAREDAPIDLGPLEGFASAISPEMNRAGPCFLGDSLIDDLENAAFAGAPIFFEIELSVHGEHFGYQALLIPHADDGSHATEIAVIAEAGDVAFAPA